ncbi:uncharacterized protein [Asterias amurensis]|uniref:uncharacterized protein isoform X2 n=1 Tax=Asterias amurensis TaxID=7602 RepID=UPI003AB1424A
MAEELTTAASMDAATSDSQPEEHRPEVAPDGHDGAESHHSVGLSRVELPAGEPHSTKNRQELPDNSISNPSMSGSNSGDLIGSPEHEQLQMEQQQDAALSTASTMQDKPSRLDNSPEVTLTEKAIVDQQDSEIDSGLDSPMNTEDHQSALNESLKVPQNDNIRNNLHPTRRNGNEESDVKTESNSYHGDTCTSDPNYTYSQVDAPADNTLEDKMAHSKHQIESNGSCIKTDTGGNEACRSWDPSGPKLAEPSLGVASKTQTAAVPHNSYIKHHDTETPRANLDSAEKRDSIDIVNKGEVCIIKQALSAGTLDTCVTKSSSTNCPPSHPQPTHLASSMGVAASSNWVSFEDEDNVQSSPGRGREETAERGDGWVKFETSPTMPKHPVLSQLTGGSSDYSIDRVCDDQQSDITMSVPSSRGSLSESRDNVHISQEYLPLGSSPSPQPKSTVGMASWINFTDGSSRSTRKMQSPPSHLPLSSPPRLHSRSSSESPISSMSSPSHVAPQVNQRQHGTPQSGAHQISVRTGWVSFDEPDTSSSPASPIRMVSDGRDVNTPSPLLIERDAAEKRVNLQQLQQSIAVQQQQQIQNREYQPQQQPQPVILPMPYQQKPAASIRGVPEAIPTNPTLLSLARDSSITFQPSTSTPAPGNPFREEMLRQQQRATSPLNPFQSNGLQTPSTPGGTVGAMWGESPITPGTVDAMWERFEETTAAAAQVAHGSPGNPFISNESTSVYTPQHQVAPGQVAGATAAEIQTPQHHLIKDSTIPLKELAQLFPAQNASVDQLSMSTSSTTPNQSTPTTTQPFQRYTKASKQVTIRASGKRPKVNQTQPEDIVIDNTPFIDEFPRDKPDLRAGWAMMLRCPDKKKVAGSRYWKPVRVKLIEGNAIQLFDDENSSEPFRELPLQCNYELGDRKLQSYDTLGKIHTLKLLYVSFSEKRRYNTRTPYEKVLHANPLLKLGSTDYDVFRSFIITINDYLMKLPSFRDRGISYKQDAIGVVVADDFRCRIKCNGELEKQSIKVGITMLAFLSDMPDCSIALNDVQVKGMEVMSKRDIIPNKTNQWIKLDNVELHKCANKNVFVESRFVEFSPLDGCRFCLMRFATRPRQSMELPLHVKVTVTGEGAYLELRVDLVLAAHPVRRDPSQFTCENVMVRIPIPETWIKYFRREKRLGFYSVKSANGKPDHIKRGSLNPRLLETSTGSAKYEHAYKSIVWRIEKLPEKTSVFSASHILMCRIHLGSHREVPRTPQGDAEIEFTMPQTTASRCTVRSLAVASDKPSEKRIRYTAHYEYFVEIENKVVLQMLDGDDGNPDQCHQQ